MDKRNRILLFLLALPLLFASLLTDGCAGSSIGGNAGPYDIIFESISDVSTEQIGIYGINADGTGLTLITDYGYSPTLSPDGKKIAFISKPEDDWQIHVMDADGSGQIKLINMNGEPSALSWSPDSDKIAFDYNSNIYVMHINGSNLTPITNDDRGNTNPLWSPAGDKILFISNGETRLVNTDGTRIAFSSKRDGNWEIYVMDAYGEGQSNITNNAVRDGAPTWSPASR